MPRITAPTFETAPEATRPLFHALKLNLGMVPNLFATIGHSPQALEFLLSATETLSKGHLSAREIESINVYASELNGCGYCVSAHATLSKRTGMEPTELAQVRAGRGHNGRVQAILDLVRRVVRTGGLGAGTELAQARESGVSDAEVMEVLAHVALKAFTNAAALVAQVDIDFPKQPRLPQV